MTSFKDVKAGDRVRLTRDNGDDLTFTVQSTEFNNDCIVGAAHNRFIREEGWNVEILQKPLPTGEYAVIGHPGPNDMEWAPYIRQGGDWWEAELPESQAFEVTEDQIRVMMRDHGFKVLYEGIQQ